MNDPRTIHHEARKRGIIGAGLLATCLVIVVITMLSSMGRLDRQGQAILQLSQQLREVESVANANADEVSRLGGQPIPVPEVTPVSNEIVSGTGNNTIRVPRDGRDGRDAEPITDAQAQIAFAAYCAPMNGCKGDTGKAGPALTPEQAIAALTQFCSTDGICRGEEGEQGPPPTEDQIRAVVAQVCSNDGCRGQAGNDGQDGRGIADNGTRCDAGTRRWVITYTDGKIEDGGVCLIQPSPQPTATVTEKPDPAPTETETVTVTPDPAPTATETVTITPSPTDSGSTPEPTEEETP